MRYVKLERTDGVFEIILRPTYSREIDGAIVPLGLLVSVYADIILEQAIELARDMNISLEDDRSDDRLFPLLQPYYQKVLDLLSNNAVKADLLTQSSRHKFFITTGLKVLGEEPYLGQSQLSWLLGNNERETIEEGIEQAPEGLEGTGDPWLDAVGQMAVLFQKGEVSYLLQTFSLEEMMQIGGFVGQILNKALSDEKDIEQPPEAPFLLNNEELESLQSKYNLPKFSS